jgi:hypothetical protein
MFIAFNLPDSGKHGQSCLDLKNDPVKIQVVHEDDPDMFQNRE